MDKVVSIVVAIYNVDKYLEQCIESIISQSYKNLEIILVDDGSTDKSRYICDTYSGLDDRIKVIHKDNGGVSSARNAGIDISTGDYITFVDGDDHIEPNMYELMIKNIEDSRCNIGVCGYSTFYDNSNKVKISDKSTEIVVMNNDLALEKIFTTNQINGFLWNKVFSRTLFKEIRLLEDMDICEDLYVVCSMLIKNINIIYIPQPLYNYRNNLNGATKNMNNIFLDCGKSKYIDAFERISKIFVNKKDVLELLRIKCIKTNIDTYYLMIKNNYTNKAASIHIFNSLKKESIYYLTHRKVSLKFKLALIVFNIKLSLYNWERIEYD